MATVYSDQLARMRSGRNVKSNEWAGKVRVVYWNFASLPAGNIGDVLVCGRLRQGERVLQGREFHTAMGGTATVAYSTYAIAADGQSLGAVITAGKYLGATTAVSAGQNELASTLALNALAEEGNTGVVVGSGMTTDVFLCAVNAGSAFATAGQVTGYMLVTAD